MGCGREQAPGNVSRSTDLTTLPIVSTRSDSATASLQVEDDDIAKKSQLTGYIISMIEEKKLYVKVADGHFSNVPKTSEEAKSLILAVGSSEYQLLYRTEPKVSFADWLKMNHYYLDECNIIATKKYFYVLFPKDVRRVCGLCVGRATGDWFVWSLNFG
jgi:thioredoxin reductase